MKRKIYLETSVISYLTALPSKTILGAAHQQITQAWCADVVLSQYCQPDYSRRYCPLS
jgi:hypothetical protein